jgi:hypothetical protein
MQTNEQITLKKYSYLLKRLFLVYIVLPGVLIFLVNILMLLALLLHNTFGFILLNLKLNLSEFVLQHYFLFFYNNIGDYCLYRSNKKIDKNEL